MLSHYYSCLHTVIEKESECRYCVFEQLPSTRGYLHLKAQQRVGTLNRSEVELLIEIDFERRERAPTNHKLFAVSAMANSTFIGEERTRRFDRMDSSHGYDTGRPERSTTTDPSNGQ